MADSQPGPRPAWSGWSFGLAALAVALFVVFFAPAAPDPDDTAPPSSEPGPTITLDDLEAMLTDDVTPPATIDVLTPEGPVTVVVPATTRPPAPTTTTTTTTTVPTTTTTTTPPRPSVPPVNAQDILDDLLGTRTTTPEGAGGET